MDEEISPSRPPGAEGDQGTVRARRRGTIEHHAISQSTSVLRSAARRPAVCGVSPPRELPITQAIIPIIRVLLPAWIAFQVNVVALDKPNGRWILTLAAAGAICRDARTREWKVRLVPGVGVQPLGGIDT